MSTIPRFTSVPGQSVPGMGQPALIAVEPPATTYKYYGHMVLYYLDYLDVTTQVVLVAVPGNSYLMQAVNSRAGLTVPPPDGRWNPSTVRDLIVFRPRPLPPAVASGVLTLREARAAAGPGFVPPPYVPLQREAAVLGGARFQHAAPAVAVAPQRSLAEARAAIGPGVVPEPYVPVQADPAGVAPGWFRHESVLPPVAPPQPSLAEVRVAIEAAKGGQIAGGRGSCGGVGGG